MEVYIAANAVHFIDRYTQRQFPNEGNSDAITISRPQI